MTRHRGHEVVGDICTCSVPGLCVVVDATESTVRILSSKAVSIDDLCVFIMYLFFFKHEKTTTHEYFEYKTKNQII